MNIIGGCLWWAESRPQQGYPHPNLWNPGVYYLTWHRGLCRYDRIHDLEVGRLHWIIQWAQCNRRVLIRRMQGHQRLERRQCHVGSRE